MLRSRLRVLSKMHLIFDFDGTITTKDTINHLASAGIAAQKLSRGANLQPAWDSLVQAYLADYDAYRVRYAPKEADRTSPRCGASARRPSLRTSPSRPCDASAPTPCKTATSSCGPDSSASCGTRAKGGGPSASSR
ncbi:hypothetical protein NLG97_g10721 [Lecanicillium saksenae]|uniref:Uncharacterized protein n=1 Tax=Lecanicillium saksenae TaxID=468837 RepID=A0ACC1QG85_9HYPO|nr:hypothetical protein NLG97_g10721 [Lecanicillium saksenae]